MNPYPVALTAPDEPVGHGDSNTLTYQSVLAGLVSASGRFVPVPFVDDVIRQRCRKFVVSRTLVTTGSPTQLGQLEPLYGETQGWLSGCSGLLVKAPLKLFLFPVRKFVAIVASVRGVPIEVMRCVLLTRTVQRFAASEAIDRSEATRIRAAFDETMHRMDFRTLRAALRDTLRGVGHWKESAMELARRVSKTSEPIQPELGSNDPAQNGARAMAEVFQRPETLRLFDQFDRRFDENLRRLKSES